MALYISLFVIVVFYSTSTQGQTCAPGYTSPPDCEPCPDGLWGVNCVNQCHCTVPCVTSDGRCQGGSCTDNYAGSTCQQCDPTYWGSSCTDRCYCSGGCDQSTGACGNNPCHTGYTGNRCTDCADYYKQGSGSTCVPCDGDEWGTRCGNTCLNCMGGCYDNDGRCRPGGCRTGYTGSYCQDCDTGYRSSGSSCEPCSNGYYGDGCTARCRCTVTCDHVTGECPGECDVGYVGNPCTRCRDGWWGTNCANTCNCRTACSKDTGRCTGGCNTGYTGHNCQQCATGYTGSSCSTCTTGYYRTGNTCQRCSSGFWGNNCSNQCHCTHTCNHVTGACSSCTEGYTGSPCQQCSTGRWGLNCANNCNCRTNCNHVTGVCTGGCNTGFTGNTCQQCATGYTGSTCSTCTAGYYRTSGRCQSCSNGRWGDNCANQCHCSSTCNKVTGHCSTGCNVGYTGSPCRECTAGRWGRNCVTNCNCRATCNHVTGVCTGGCNTGFTGTTCQQCATGYTGSSCSSCTTGYHRTFGRCDPCRDGRWGIGCGNDCHCTRTCNKANGVCGAPCEPGYYGSQCPSTCTAKTWGAGRPGSNNRCPGNCNCADPDEVCSTTDGHCDSGCTDWYTSTGCDYEMPRLGVMTPQILHHNGRNITVQFMQWRSEFGGNGTVSHYMIEYKTFGIEDYSTLSDLTFDTESSASNPTINIELPDVRTNYLIQIVPYESSDAYSGPGEPSANVSVYTQCADGWFGVDCNQTCNCANDNICNKTSGACPGCRMGYLGGDCQTLMPALNNVTVQISWEDNKLSISFEKLEEHDVYSLTYDLQYKLKDEQNWQQRTVSQHRTKRFTLPNELFEANSKYDCRIVPIFYDKERLQNTNGYPSTTHEIVTGCKTPSDVSQFYPSACEHWCECGDDEYCLLTSGYCNGLCDAQCARLPNANNTDVVIKAHSESIEVYITNNRARIEYYTLVYSRDGHNDSLQYNHTSIDGSILTGLSPNTAYTINVYPFTSRSSKVYVSPPITKEISTFPPEDGSPIVVIVCIVLVLLLIIAVVVCLLVYFLIIRKRRNKKKYSDNEKDYYNLTNTNVPISTVNGCEYAEAEPTKAANTGLYANDAAITKAAADASKKPKLAVKPATKSKPVVAGITCSVDEFIKKWSKIPDAQLEDEYKAIPENKEATSERGDLKVNYEKHRFNNIKAYDHSRVVLDKLEDDPYSDYVNAAFITGYGGTEKAFVASQGPRKPTIGDMWRLIWKINTNLIVMLTNLLENKKIKCKQYWPDDQARFYHGIQVETLETKNYAFYTRRLFLVKKEDETRQITHMQFTQWPDHGVPETPNELMEFFFIVQSMESSLKGPLMVHCSAGVGRTGTFIALDYLLKQAAAENAVDVCACVTELRRNRCQMVQTASQYVFLHKALRQTLISKPSSIKMEAFIPSIVESDDYTTKLVDQYNRLNKIRPKALDATTAKSRENIEKNSDPSVLADDKHRVKLTTAVDGCTDYIQAVKCGTYTQTDALVLTQIPLKRTIADIWRLCHETTVCSIITLEGEVAVPYWPQELEKSDLYGPLEVTFNSESSTNYQGVTVRNFTLKKDSKKNCTKIKQWHVHTAGERGEEGGEETIHAWLHVYEQARNWKLSDSSASSTVLIQCRDGAQRSGAFAAMWSILEKLEAESVVDVDFAIRRVRQCRPQAVVSDQQYQMLYDIVKVYLEDRQTGYYNA